MKKGQIYTRDHELFRMSNVKVSIITKHTKNKFALQFGLPYPNMAPMLPTSMPAGLPPSLTPGTGPFGAPNHIGAFQPKVCKIVRVGLVSTWMLGSAFFCIVSLWRSTKSLH